MLISSFRLRNEFLTYEYVLNQREGSKKECIDKVHNEQLEVSRSNFHQNYFQKSRNLNF